MVVVHLELMNQVVKTTVELFRAINEPLVKVGALSQAEHATAMRALKIAGKARSREGRKDSRMLTRKSAAERLEICKATVSSSLLVMPLQFSNQQFG